MPFAFDRAAALHAEACRIIGGDARVTPGEKAAVLALLAQNEILIGIAVTLTTTYEDEVLEQFRRNTETEVDRAEDSIGDATEGLLGREVRGT